MKSGFIGYNGHGMIERYPKSMSETYIVDHETRHRVNNRLKALSSGEAISQSTSYNVSFSVPKEEFATIRQFSDVISNSLIFMRRDVPGILLQDGTGSALQTQNALKSLKQGRGESFFETRFTFHSDFASLRARDLKEFGNRLAKLDRVAGVLGSSENFTLKRASTSEPEAITLSTSPESPEGNFSIKVSELARGERVVSKKFDDPFAPLNLSGSFSVNGYSISVSESDSLNDIATKINYGEDSNKNGVLDLSEDSNANGTLDSIFIPGVITPDGFSGSFSYFEDIDSDKQIDPSEDLNNNMLLDGGTSQHNVSAFIERGRLNLQSVTSNNISLSADTGILKEIGFFTERGDGAIIRQDRQLLDDGTNLDVRRKKAELTVNGTQYRRESNHVDDIIPSTNISVKQKTSRNISASIKSDFSGLKGLIKELGSSYNDVMEFINNQELSFKILDKNVYVQNVRSRMIESLKSSVPERGLKDLSAKEIGIDTKNRKRKISQLSLTNLAYLVKKSSASSTATPFSGQNSLLGSLERAGVTKTGNDQIHLDEAALDRSLKNNPEETISLIAGERGISAKIKKLTGSFLNQVTGVLRLRQDVAKIYADNQTAFQTQQQQRGRIRSSSSQKRVLNTILSRGITSDSGRSGNAKTDRVS